MIRRNSRIAVLCAAGLAALLLGSCSSRLGWGLVLWTAPEGPIPAGSIVPVYIKSNIEKVYVVGVPGAKGKEKGKKIELKLWQLELYSTRAKAEAAAKAMGPNLSLYMVAMRDGLPLRDGPSNTGRRVYRLRVGQTLKVLEKVSGEAVSTGGQTLPGSWYRVLADDGTTGYAFSYAFRVYDESKEGPPAQAAAKKEPLSGRVDLFFSRTWRPEYFQEMLDDNRVDLDYFSLHYGHLRRRHPQAGTGSSCRAASELFVYQRDIVEVQGHLRQFEGYAAHDQGSRATRAYSNAPGRAASPTRPIPGPTSAEPAAEDLADGEGLVFRQTAEADAEQLSAAPRGGDRKRRLRGPLLRAPRDHPAREHCVRQKLLTSFADEVGGAHGRARKLGKLVINKNGRFSWKGTGRRGRERLPALEASGSGGEDRLQVFSSTLRPRLDLAAASFSLRFDPAADASGAIDANQDRPWVDFLYRSELPRASCSRARPRRDSSCNRPIPAWNSLFSSRKKSSPWPSFSSPRSAWPSAPATSSRERASISRRARAPPSPARTGPANRPS